MWPTVATPYFHILPCAFLRRVCFSFVISWLDAPMKVFSVSFCHRRPDYESCVLAHFKISLYVIFLSALCLYSAATLTVQSVSMQVNQLSFLWTVGLKPVRIFVLQATLLDECRICGLPYPDFHRRYQLRSLFVSVLLIWGCIFLFEQIRHCSVHNLPKVVDKFVECLLDGVSMTKSGADSVGSISRWMMLIRRPVRKGADLFWYRLSTSFGWNQLIYLRLEWLRGVYLPRVYSVTLPGRVYYSTLDLYQECF